MPKPPVILFDFSKFTDYLLQKGPTGIARIDLAYANFLKENPEFFGFGLHDSFVGSTYFSHSLLKDMIEAIEYAWREKEEKIPKHLINWIYSKDISNNIRLVASSKPVYLDVLSKIASLIKTFPLKNTNIIPQEEIFYLNTSYANLKYKYACDWLKENKKISPIFMMHDLIPIDHPNLFWNGIEKTFPRQIEAILQNAKTIIVPSLAIKNRLLQYKEKININKQIDVEILHHPPASEFLTASYISFKRDVYTPSYFIICGTIEPRKNHMFLLNIWEEIIKEKGMNAPKLLIIGNRGWKNKEIIERLEKTPILRGYVLEVSELSTIALRDLIVNATALLSPSIDEGYGMPIVEALSQGTPVIASDITVFKEISKGCADLLSLQNPKIWKDRILSLSKHEDEWWNAKRLASSFIPQSWEEYFKNFINILQKTSENKIISKQKNEIYWPYSIFTEGETHIYPSNKEKALLGPARCLYYGPYRKLSKGKWSGILEFTLSSDCREIYLKLDIYCGEIVAEFLIFAEAGGNYKFPFEFEVENGDISYEVRLFLERGEIIGDIYFNGVRLLH